MWRLGWCPSAFAFPCFYMARFSRSTRLCGLVSIAALNGRLYRQYFSWRHGRWAGVDPGFSSVACGQLVGLSGPDSRSAVNCQSASGPDNCTFEFRVRTKAKSSQGHPKKPFCDTRFRFHLLPQFVVARRFAALYLIKECRNKGLPQPPGLAAISSPLKLIRPAPRASARPQCFACAAMAAW